MTAESEPQTLQETMEMLADSNSFLPRHDFNQRSDETVTIELSEANAFRVAQAVALAAHHILQQEEGDTEVAARQAMSLSQEVKRQMRQQIYSEIEQ